jgi:hypothetical protein
MKVLFNLVRFPFLFLYYVGSSLAAKAAPERRGILAVAFVVGTLVVALSGIQWLFRPSLDESVPAVASDGLHFSPSSTDDSIIRVTVLESALGRFHFEHGRSPRDYAELARANYIRDLPQPKAGNEFQIDFETPSIREVPVGTKAPPHPDQPEVAE